MNMVAKVGLATGIGMMSAVAALAQEDVSISMSTGVNQVATIVARDMGYFAEEGINIDLKPVNRGAIAIEAVAGGSVNFAESSHTSFFSAAAQGISLEGVGVVSRGFFGRLIAKPEFANLTSLEDFKGKRVGTQVGTGMHLTIQQLLEMRGLTEEELGITNIRVNDMPAAMASGDAFDAVIGWDPAAERIVQSGFGVEILSTGDFMELAGITYPFVLTAMADYIAENPEVVQGVVNAYARAHRYISDNPDEALQLYVADLRAAGNDLDEETVRQMVFDVDRFGGVAFTEADWNDLTATVDYMVKIGRLEAGFDASAIIIEEFGQNAEGALN